MENHEKELKMTEILAHRYSSEGFSESYPINTNMIRLGVFRKSLRSCALDKGSLSNGWINSWNAHRSHKSYINIIELYLISINNEIVNHKRKRNLFLPLPICLLYQLFCTRNARRSYKAYSNMFNTDMFFMLLFFFINIFLCVRPWCIPVVKGWI